MICFNKIQMPSVYVACMSIIRKIRNRRNAVKINNLLQQGKQISLRTTRLVKARCQKDIILMRRNQNKYFYNGLQISALIFLTKEKAIKKIKIPYRDRRFICSCSKNELEIAQNKTVKSTLNKKPSQKQIKIKKIFSSRWPDQSAIISQKALKQTDSYWIRIQGRENKLKQVKIFYCIIIVNKQIEKRQKRKSQIKREKIGNGNGQQCLFAKVYKQKTLLENLSRNYLVSNQQVVDEQLIKKKRNVIYASPEFMLFLSFNFTLIQIHLILKTDVLRICQELSYQKIKKEIKSNNAQYTLNKE